MIILDPADTANASIEWSDLGNATIVSVAYTPIAGVTLTPQGVTGTGSGTVSTVRVSGMVHGRTYQIEATATLSTGETLNRNIAIMAFNG
jgi:hypothetical protein